jgi:transposase-like protein
MKASGVPERITMDKSSASKASIDEINTGSAMAILVRQVRYLNPLVEQDHQAVQCVIRPMLNFKSFQSVKDILVGIELIHIIRKGQRLLPGASELSFDDQLYALTGKIRFVRGIGIRF